MSIQAILLDIDGTLLTSDKQVSDATKQALLRAQANGVRVVLASGRPTSSMMVLAKELELQDYHGLLVSYNGAQVVDVSTNTVLYSKSLSIEDSKAVLEHIKAFNVRPMIDRDDTMYVNNVFDCFVDFEGKTINIIEYESRAGNYQLCEKHDLVPFIDFPVYKILTAGDSDYLKRHYQAMMEPFKDSLSCMFTAPVYFEYTAKGIDKAKALQFVFEELNICVDNVIAFGDGHNDISMVKLAKFGVAMGNAVDELKAIADFTTKSNDEDGIPFALAHYGV